MLAKLVERVELRRLGGEVVVELGQVLLAHLLDRDREDRGLAGELLGLVIVGEGDLDRRARRPAPRPRARRRTRAGGPRRRARSGSRFASEPSNGSPSIVPAKSISDRVARRAPGARRASGSRSPRAAARARLRPPRREPRAPACRPRAPCSRRARPPGGRTTSIEKASSSPSAGSSPTSSFGSPIALTPESSSARSYHSGSESRSACSTTASRPNRWITSCGGTLPLRKPGIFISPASAFAARSTRFATSVGLDRDVDLDLGIGELGDCQSSRARA